MTGPQIKRMLRSADFETSLNEVEKEAWKCIRLVIENFLGNYRATNYKEIIGNMLTAFKNLKVHMSLKIHFLADHLDFFPENLGAVSDEQGERFHQDIAMIEQRYKGKNSLSMIGNYLWSITRNTDPEELSRKTRRPSFHVEPE